MALRTRIAKIAVGVVLAAIAAAPAFGHTTRQQHHALWARAHATNVIYGLGKPAAMTHSEYKAMLIRGAALNQRYGLPVAITPDEIALLYASGARG